ncbi:NADH-ubiquinone oxidoreductase chain 1-like [Solenopsis invicta]|uniref:NADH-ubiquinone oxidoreductase chain 1-like n=1 Tax=Solenopsis invicta TaxID=13686 RepID=UPI00193D0FDC|nr:NADH-ubiquinone oxidoreductase chain 1-like [Solenopsis invicta]
MDRSSSSIYSLIGSIRVISQVLSYEVRFIIIILILIILRDRYSFVDFLIYYLVFRICEGVLGLRLLVIIVRMGEKDMD